MYPLHLQLTDMIRLPAIAVSRFLPLLWDDDNCTERDVEGICSILSSPAGDRGRVSSVIFRVRAWSSYLTAYRLDSADGTVTVMNKVLNTMTQALLQSPNFDLYEDIAPPFGILLFYLFDFIVSVCTAAPLHLVINASAIEYPCGSVQSGILSRNK